MTHTPLPKTSNPVQSALEAAGISSLEQLTQHSEAEIAQLHGMGPKALRILKEALAERGLGFKDENQSELSAAGFLMQLKSHASPAQQQAYERYFPGQAKEFIGVRMGQVFALAKAHGDMPLAEIEKLLDSNIREARVGAVSIMEKSARGKKTDEARRKALYELYLRRHARINTWDLVDLGAQHIVGAWLVDKPRDVLYQLAASDSWPERRTALVACFAFVRRGELDDALKLAGMLAEDPEEYVQKAVGWLLRTVGDADRQRLLAFLAQHAARLPRPALLAAIEKLDKAERARWLAKS
ncbi:MAG: DNA alkylation repair protein [Anaerolineales bacterium]|nr:DNA alkylation repair protein [Anaerolineales bacterium]